MNFQKAFSRAITFIFLGWITTSQAIPITIANAGFEDISGQSASNEFTFGLPTEWMPHDPNNIIGSPGVFLGTLQPNGVDFFNTTAPEGSKVALLFNSSQLGQGEYGYTQTLADTLQANTQYTLSVEVGNIASGTAQSGTFFNLSGFPGYRIDLLAGGQVIAADNNTLVIPEAEFRTAVIFFNTSSNSALLGQLLGIRLVNLNLIPTGSNSPDLEVDFDDIQLDAVITSSAPVCTTQPNPADIGIEITTNCTGIEIDAIVTIPNMSCTSTGATTASCTGIIGSGTGQISVENDTVTVTGSTGSVNTAATTGLDIVVFGDCTGEGNINIQDVICDINIVLDDGISVHGANCDKSAGAVNIQDVICTINKVLAGP